MGTSTNVINNKFDNNFNNNDISIESIGIIPRVIKNLFSIINEREIKNPNNTFRIHIQFLEVYGDDIRDLLNQTKSKNNKKEVIIREMPVTGEVFLTNIREESVKTYEEVLELLKIGINQRTTSSTKMNKTSSRSHAIFTIISENTIIIP